MSISLVFLPIWSFNYFVASNSFISKSIKKTNKSTDEWKSQFVQENSDKGFVYWFSGLWVTVVCILYNDVWWLTHQNLSIESLIIPWIFVAKAHKTIKYTLHSTQNDKITKPFWISN